jgi:FkbM family methyltransferase
MSCAVNRSRLSELVKLLTNFRGERNAVFRQYLFRLLAGVAPVIAVDSGGVRYFLSTADDLLSRSIFVQGFYEGPLLKKVLEALAAVSIRAPNLRESVFVDIGANYGTATLAAMLNWGAQYAVAVEPDPANFEMLQHNVLANKLDHRVSLRQAALSDHEATVDLAISSTHPGTHRVIRDPSGGECCASGLGRNTIQVPATTLQSVLDEECIDLGRVGLVWIDTEGYEPHVLAGAASLLESNVPVLIELWPWALRAANGVERLISLVSINYTHILDLALPWDGESPPLCSASEIQSVVEAYDRRSMWTDLLLLTL